MEPPKPVESVQPAPPPAPPMAAAPPPQQYVPQPQYVQQPQQPPVAYAPPPAPARSSPRVPAWAMTLMFAGAFIAIGAGLFTVLRTRSPQENAQAAAPAGTDSPRLPDPAAAKAHPLLKSLEVTGLRLTEDAKQKAQLQFVLVNHSAADIAGLVATAKIVAVNAKQGDLPMGTFIIKTDLAPYEAKNMKVPVDTKLRAYELPDWQFIRADMDITAP